MDVSDFERYLDLLAVERSLGGALEITALANALNLKICIFLLA